MDNQLLKILSVLFLAVEYSNAPTGIPIKVEFFFCKNRLLSESFGVKISFMYRLFFFKIFSLLVKFFEIEQLDNKVVIKVNNTIFTL